MPPRIVGLVLALLLTACLFGACRKSTWIPPKKKAVYKARITNLIPETGEEAILIEKLNEFPWNHVEFKIKGKSGTFYACSVVQVATGQQRALRDAYTKGDVTPDTIELVESHGTGTRVGDAIEATALQSSGIAGSKAS